jgi:hypothetical protein
MMSPIAIWLLGVIATPSAETVRLTLGDCVPSRDLVHDLVAIEIGFERLVERDAAVSVIVACHANEVSIAIEHTTLARTIARAEVGSKIDGARLVALNIVELINSASKDSPQPRPRTETKSEMRTRAAPGVQAGTETKSEARAAPGSATETNLDPAQPSASLRTRFSAAPALRYDGSDQLALGVRATAALDAAKDAGFVWTLQLTAGVEQSNTTVALGSIRTRAANISLAAGERIDLTRDVAIFGLLGASGGWVNLTSSTDDAEVITKNGSGLWFGPMLAARIRYGARAGISLGIEAGLVTKEVYGELDGGERFGQRGPWLGADLAIDWSAGER